MLKKRKEGEAMFVLLEHSEVMEFEPPVFFKFKEEAFKCMKTRFIDTLKESYDIDEATIKEYTDNDGFINSGDWGLGEAAAYIKNGWQFSCGWQILEISNNSETAESFKNVTKSL